jgi:hypothetical protein
MTTVANHSRDGGDAERDREAEDVLDESQAHAIS